MPAEEPQITLPRNGRSGHRRHDVLSCIDTVGISLAGLVEDAVALGATLEHGGGAPEEYETGYYFTPTVLTGVRADMRVMQEEPFGPIAPIATFATFDEAVSIANATPYGLGGFVFTDDLTTAFRASEELEVGMVGVNHLTIATAEAYPNLK